MTATNIPPIDGHPAEAGGLSGDPAFAIPPTTGQWFGHPSQLARLFSTEMWERFGYYGMRALLTLYLAQHFMFSDVTTNGIYGGYTALVYLTPLIGGLIADRYFGSKRAVKFGAILMALGYLTLAFGGQQAKPYAIIEGQRYEVTVEGNRDARKQYLTDQGQKLQIKGNEDGSISLLGANGQEARKIEGSSFKSDAERSQTYIFLLLLGLSLVSVGNGFFKPNISTMVGELYAKDDPRRDAGFTIFYMGINLGSLLSQFLCPLLAVGMGSWNGFGWWAGFLLAAVGMVVSWALIQFNGGRLNGIGERPAGANPAKDWIFYAGAIFAVPLAWLLFNNLMGYVKPEAGSGFFGYVASLPLMGKMLFGTFLVAVPGILAWAWAKGSRKEFQMMVAAMVLITFNTVFWTLFEQAGSSLTLFAERNTNLSVFGLFELTAAQTQVFNPIFIVFIAPLLSAMWIKLAKHGLEPSIPVKFALALMGVGIGFLLLVFGTRFADSNFQLGIGWLVLLYLFHSTAELFISPVGLSMITKLSIARIVGLMMGVWFLSISVAQYVAGLVAQFASVETVGGQVTNLKLSLETYTQVFDTIGWISVAAGGVLLVIAWPLRKLMHGVK